MADPNPARLAFVIISFILVLAIKYLSYRFLFRQRTLYMPVTINTYQLGILAALSKLFYESNMVHYQSTSHLGEIAILAAMSLHKTMAVLNSNFPYMTGT